MVAVMTKQFLSFLIARDLVLVFRLGCLKALEQGKCAGTLGNVAEKMIGKVDQGAVLDLGGRKGRSDEFLGRGFGKLKDGALYQRAAQLAVDVAEGILVVVRIACQRADKMAGGGMDGAAKGFKLS